MKHYLVLTLLWCTLGHAAEVYKWKDEQGQIHFGDKQPTGMAGETINLKTAPAKAVQPESLEDLAEKTRRLATENAARSRPQNRPDPGDIKDRTPVPDKEVPPRCLALIDAVNKTPPGPASKGTAAAFVKACPGIARECRTYRTHQKDSYCIWVKQNGNEPISHLVETD